MKPPITTKPGHTGQQPLRNVQGEVVGVITIVRDIIKRKRAEEELRDSLVARSGRPCVAPSGA